MQMLTIQSHRPAAATDLRFMYLKLNSGFSSVPAKPCVTVRPSELGGARVLDTLPWLRREVVLVEVLQRLRNLATSPIIFLAPAHVRSTFLRLAPLGASMYDTAAVTLSTAAGGDVRPLSSPSAFLSRPSSAASALWMAGSAAARSLLACAWKSATPLAISATSASSMAALRRLLLGDARLLAHLHEQLVGLLAFLLDDDRLLLELDLHVGHLPCASRSLTRPVLEPLLERLAARACLRRARLVQRDQLEVRLGRRVHLAPLLRAVRSAAIPTTRCTKAMWCARSRVISSDLQLDVAEEALRPPR